VYFLPWLKIPELSVLAESQTAEPVSARGMLPIGHKFPVISPYPSLFHFIWLAAVLVIYI